MYSLIRSIIDKEARLSVPAADLTPGADLYALGMTPYSAVRVLLAVERNFEIEFPRTALKRETMGSLDAIAQAIRFARAESRRPTAA